MDRLVPISEARATLADLVTEADTQEVYLLKHGRSVGVLLSAAGWERILDRIEELEDELSVLRHHPGQSIAFERTE